MLDRVDVTCWPAGPCAQAETRLTTKSAVQCKVWRMPTVTLFSSPPLLLTFFAECHYGSAGVSLLSGQLQNVCLSLTPGDKVDLHYILISLSNAGKIC